MQAAREAAWLITQKLDIEQLSGPKKLVHPASRSAQQDPSWAANAGHAQAEPVELFPLHTAEICSGYAEIFASLESTRDTLWHKLHSPSVSLHEPLFHSPSCPSRALGGALVALARHLERQLSGLALKLWADGL